MYTRARFSLFQQVSKKKYVGLHSAPVWGAQSSTILTLGGPGLIFGGPAGVAFFEVAFECFLEAGEEFRPRRSGEGQVKVAPPLHPLPSRATPAAPECKHSVIALCSALLAVAQRSANL